MPDPTAPEPTMEEILASIRRIITEEDTPLDTGAAESPPKAVAAEPKPAEPAPEAAESAADKPTAPAPWNGEMPAIEPEPAPVAAAPEPPQPATIVYTPAPAEPSVFAKPVLAAVHPTPEAPAPVFAAATAGHDAPLVSPQTSAETASAFNRLSEAVKIAPKEDSIMLPPPGRSLEDLTRELLRPLLQEWLDEHLPEIVRQQVEEEVARIARGRAG